MERLWCNYKNVSYLPMDFNSSFLIIHRLEAYAKFILLIVDYIAFQILYFPKKEPGNPRSANGMDWLLPQYLRLVC